MGELTDRMRAAANWAAGTLKDVVANAANNEELQAEGKAQRGKGSAQTGSRSVNGALGNDI